MATSQNAVLNGRTGRLLLDVEERMAGNPKHATAVMSKEALTECIIANALSEKLLRLCCGKNVSARNCERDQTEAWSLQSPHVR
jgi:hypothetical protein